KKIQNGGEWVIICKDSKDAIVEKGQVEKFRSLFPSPDHNCRHVGQINSAVLTNKIFHSLKRRLIRNLEILSGALKNHSGCFNIFFGIRWLHILLLQIY